MIPSPEATAIMPIANKSIISNGTDLKEVCHKLLDSLIKENEDAELMTLITGADSSEDVTNDITSYVEDNSDIEVDVIQGDVPVYYYLIGLE